MKKFIVVLMCFLMILSLFSCEANTDKNTEKTNESGNTENNSAVNPEAEKAMKAYESVLKNETKVYETDIKKYNYLKDCKTPYNGILLSDCAKLKYAYTDMDNDSIKELVIDCGDTLILRYYQETVYVYGFTFRNIYYLTLIELEKIIANANFTDEQLAVFKELNKNIYYDYAIMLNLNIPERRYYETKRIVLDKTARIAQEIGCFDAINRH